MTAANASRGIRRAMWCLLIVTRAPAFCYADSELSVEDVIVNYINCAYFDCDGTSFVTDYNSDGTGYINSEIVLTKDLAANAYTAIHAYQCILNECKTSMGLTASKTMASILAEPSFVNTFLKTIGIQISPDCDCIRKGSYTIIHYCPDKKDVMEGMPNGRYLAALTTYDVDNSKLLDLHVYVEVA